MEKRKKERKKEKNCEVSWFTDSKSMNEKALNPIRPKNIFFLQIYLLPSFFFF